jgi:hypothetical protein
MVTATYPVIDVVVARAILGPSVTQDGYGTVYYWDINGRHIKVTADTLRKAL